MLCCCCVWDATPLEATPPGSAPAPAWQCALVSLYPDSKEGFSVPRAPTHDGIPLGLPRHMMVLKPLFFHPQKSKQRLSKELSDCVVYCKSVHFSSFKHSRIHSKFYEVASFTESKARKHLREAGGCGLEGEV